MPRVGVPTLTGRAYLPPASPRVQWEEANDQDPQCALGTPDRAPKTFSGEHSQRAWCDAAPKMTARDGPHRSLLCFVCLLALLVFLPGRFAIYAARDAGALSESRDSAKGTNLFAVWKGLNCCL